MQATAAYERRQVPFVDAERLAIVGDPVILRDPAGRSARPSLVVDRRRGGLLVSGPFVMIQRYTITPEEGRLFVEASRDDNPIHTEDTVVSGAMTAARPILLAETALPGLRVAGLRIKYRAFARYDEPLTNVYRVAPAADGGLRIDFEVLSGRTVAAEGHVSAEERPGAPPAGRAAEIEFPCLAAGALAPASAEVEALASFYRSIRVDPGAGFAVHGCGYPRAFLAALPSGEMVRHGGAGGLLNVLDLEFPEALAPALDSGMGPSVEVTPARPRNLFRRVVARVAKDMVTYCQGYATVLLDFLKPGAEPQTPPLGLIRPLRP